MGTDNARAWQYCKPVAEHELDARLRSLLAFLAEKKAGRRFLSRSDIDPVDLKSLLGNILLVDVVPQADGDLRFRYRLFGTEFVFYHGSDLTGRWLDDVPNSGFREELLALYRLVATEGTMRTLSYDYMMERQRQRFQAVLLPLSSDGKTVDIVLGCGVPVAGPE